MVSGQAAKQVSVARRGRPRAHEQDSIPAAIVQAALALFKQKGLDATSIEQIAAAAGASKATIYRHFGTKQALAQAAVALDGLNVVSAILAMDSDDPNALERLRKLAFAIADFTALPSSADLYRLSLAAVPRIPAIGRAFDNTGNALRDHLRSRIESAQAEGHLRQADSSLMASQLYSAVILPVWSDGLVLAEYVTDATARHAAMQANWEGFLRGAQA